MTGKETEASGSEKHPIAKPIIANPDKEASASFADDKHAELQKNETEPVNNQLTVAHPEMASLLEQSLKSAREPKPEPASVDFSASLYLRDFRPSAPVKELTGPAPRELMIDEDNEDSNGGGGGGGTGGRGLSGEKSIYPADQPGCFGLDREECTVQIPQLKETKQGAHKVRPDESFDAIAEKALGKGASPAQLETFKTAVRDINGIKENQSPVTGQMLKLPGITRSGDFEFIGRGNNRIWNTWDGSKQTATGDGTITKNYRDGMTVMKTPDGDTFSSVKDGTTLLIKKDGTRITRDKEGEHIAGDDGAKYTYDFDGNFKKMEKLQDNNDRLERTPDGNGGTIDAYKGTRKENKFVLRSDKDGVLEVQNKGSEKTMRFLNKDIKEERKNLLDKAAANIKDPAELTKFKADMIRFENRMSERGASDKDINDTYKQVGRLLDKDAQGKIPHDKRMQLAEQVMSQSATPTAIDQGRYKTCTVAGLEVRTYMRKPALAAKAVADIALTGSFDGPVKRIAPHESALTQDSESEVNPPYHGDRSFASKIFQMTAVSAVWSDENPNFSYQQVKPNQSQSSRDNGERMMDTSKNPPEEISRTPEMNSLRLVKANFLMTGESEKGLVLDHAEPGKEGSFKDPGIDYFGTPDQFASKLAQAKREGRLPILLSVHSGNEPFFTDSGAGSAGGSKGWHILSVTDFDEKTGEVFVDNQWGTERDHLEKPMNFKELFATTMDPEVSRLWALRDQAGSVDPDNPLARDLKVLGFMGNDIPEVFMSNLFNEYGKQWENEIKIGTFKEANQKPVLEAFEKAFNSMKPEDKMAFLFSAKLNTVGFPQAKFLDLFAKAAPTSELTREKVQEFLARPERYRQPYFTQSNKAHNFTLFLFQQTKDSYELNRMLKALPMQEPSSLEIYKPSTQELPKSTLLPSKYY